MWRISELTRDRTPESVSKDQILRREWGGAKLFSLSRQLDAQSAKGDNHIYTRYNISIHTRTRIKNGCGPSTSQAAPPSELALARVIAPHTTY